MKIKKIIFFLSLMFLSFLSFSQGKFYLKKGIKQDKIKFRLINNLIVFPVEINGVVLSFLLDTGVSKPIIFNFLNVTDSLQIKNAEKFFLRGLGEGSYVEAYKSRNNFFKIGEALNVNQDLFAVFDPAFNFAPSLGVPIHGIIGFDVFKDFIVEINYSKKFLRLIDKNHFNPKKYKKYKKMNLSFHHKKPYINVSMINQNKQIPLKLLIDTGGSDALWLFEDKEKGINTPETYFDDFLGKGLSGNVYGKRSRINQFFIKQYEFNNVNVAYPDSSSIVGARKHKSRNGSVSGEILKRFNHVFNYEDSTLLIKKNGNYKSPFYYNKSGIIIEHHGVRVVKEQQLGYNIFKSDLGSGTNNTKIILDSSYKYLLTPAFTVTELRENSPAELAGIKRGDIILSINNNDAHKLSLQEIMQMFFGNDGKLIRLKVERNGRFLNFKFRLEDLLKKPR